MNPDRMHVDALVERQLLAIAITCGLRVADRFRRLPIEAFALDRHRVIAAAVGRAIAEGGPIDPFRVATLAAEAAGGRNRAETVMHYVHELRSTSPAAESWDYYSEQLLDAMHVRDLLAAGHELVQLGEGAAKGAAMAEVAKRAREVLDSIDDRHGLAVDLPISLQDLLDQEDEPHNWLVPELLERMDRLMLTGYEGLGKSYLLAQLALCIGGGLHPFTGQLLNPAGHRVLVLDCENSAAQIRRRYRSVAARVDGLRHRNGVGAANWANMVRLEIHPDGIDLGDARTRSRIENVIAAAAPDLILGGPLYKMHRANLNEEQAARDLVGVLDDWRGRYGVTLVLEAHVGYAGESQGGRKLRPTGSSLLLRWPEFGYGIRPFTDGDDGEPEQHPSTVQMAGWRGARDLRDWPGLLSHSNHELPWTPSDPAYRNRHGMGPFRKNLSGVA